MANDDKWPPLPQASVFAAGVVGAIFALGLALPKIFQALGEMIVLVVQATTVAVPAAAWTVPVASAGLAAAGGGTVILVLVKAAKEATEQPYEWTVPLLGIIGGLMLDLAKEYGITGTFLKALLTAVIAFLVVVAGACWKTKDWLWRVVAVILLMLPPAALLARNLEGSGAHNLMAEFDAVPAFIWIRLGGFVSVGVAVAILHTLVERRPPGRSYKR